MSLILDALRKSEAERQRGQAPGLFVQQALPPRRRRRPVGAWAAVALVLAAGLGWLGWERYRATDAPVADATPQAPHATAPGVTPAPGDVPGGAAAPMPGEPPAAAMADAPAMAGEPGAPGAPPPAPAPSPANAANAASAANSANAAAAPDATAAPAPGPTPAPAVPEGYVVDTRPPNEIPASPDLREAPAPKPGADEGAYPPRLAELPPAERAALPPLRLSMHVYAEDPAQRFVILDGRRLAEGGALAEGVVVQSIRRDGLVLSVRGQPYWLAR